MTAPLQTGVLPRILVANPELDTWIRIDRAETVTAFTGKVELGQGLITALARIVAEELDVSIERVRIETADTDHGLNELVTAGSMSISDSGAALRQAAAEARAFLCDLAAKRLDRPVNDLTVADGRIRSSDGMWISYWALLGGGRFARVATGGPAPKLANEHRIVGRRDVRRIDLEAIVTGRTRFVQDLRREGMLHGRVVRPPSPGASLRAVDESSVRRRPGVVEVVRNGSFLGVIAEHEQQAVQAADILRRRADWAEHASLPAHTTLADWLREQDSQPFLVVDGLPVAEASPSPQVEWTARATYTRGYLMHGSIGPSSAMAQWSDGRLTVWTHSQGVYLLRDAIAAAFELPPECVHVRHIVGPGSYGHNGQDDAAFDAALLARAVPGRPVLLQWSRADEHQWEPYGPPMVVELAARLGDDGRVSDWNHEVWSTTHVRRPMPGSTPNLLAGAYLDPPLANRGPEPFLIPEAGMHRNATPIYDFPGARIIKHFVKAMPLRTSSLRSLGAHVNVLAIESFVDELAACAGVSPMQFRLSHLSDERARDVLESVVAAARWTGTSSTEYGSGTGLALARYKNLAAYAAIVVRLRVEDETAKIVVGEIFAAVDCGEVVDPSGVINQIEGGALQSVSWTLKEQVRFDGTAVLSVDWDTYPILRFSEVPSVETILIDRPGQPYLGVGEVAQGPTAAAIANAVFDAVGIRVRDMPFTPERVRNAALTEAVTS